MGEWAGKRAKDGGLYLRDDMEDDYHNWGHSGELVGIVPLLPLSPPSLGR